MKRKNYSDIVLIVFFVMAVIAYATFMFYLNFENKLVRDLLILVPAVIAAFAVALWRFKLAGVKIAEKKKDYVIIALALIICLAFIVAGIFLDYYNIFGWEKQRWVIAFLFLLPLIIYLIWSFLDSRKKKKRS